MAIPKTSKIEWGASFANTWTFFGAPDNPLAVPVGVGALHISDARNVDYWDVRDDGHFSCDAVAIPRDTGGGVTGYSTASTGVYQALKWMAKGNIFRFYPDKDVGTYYTMVLIGFDPKQHITRERGGARYRVHLPMMTTDGSQVTQY
jgi:hypothetical protein